MKRDSEDFTELMKSVREQAVSRPRFLPGEAGTKLAEPGDIRLAHSLSSSTQRLVLVLLVRPELNYAKVCLLSNETEMLSDYDALLLKQQTGLPFDLVAELDLTAPIYLIQTGSWFGKLGPEAALSALQLASDGNFSEIRPALRGMPIRGPSDPRWSFKESELQILQQLSSECVEDLVEGKTIPRSVVDPVLLHQMTNTLLQDPDRGLENLLLVAESCWGGVAPEGAMSQLHQSIEEELDVNPDLQMALQPLLGCSLSANYLAQPPSSISFSPVRKTGLTEVEAEFYQILGELASKRGQRMLRLLTTRDSWAYDMRSGMPVTIGVSGQEPLYAEAVDPTR